MCSKINNIDPLDWETLSFTLHSNWNCAYLSWLNDLIDDINSQQNQFDLMYLRNKSIIIREISTYFKIEKIKNVFLWSRFLILLKHTVICFFKAFFWKNRIKSCYISVPRQRIVSVTEKNAWIWFLFHIDYFVKRLYVPSKPKTIFMVCEGHGLAVKLELLDIVTRITWLTIRMSLSVMYALRTVLWESSQCF